MKIQSDGLLVRMSKDEGLALIKILRKQGFKYGNGECGKGLYSRTWDRMLGEWWGEEFLVNPSVLIYADIDIRTLKHE